MMDPVRHKLPGLALGAAALFSALATSIRPAPARSVSEWADEHRIVAAESGTTQPGPWRTDLVPYWREPQDSMHPDHPARQVTIVASAQVGKTELIVNWFGYVVDRTPGSMLIVLPSLDEATKFNRIKLQPSIDASPTIRHKVRRENSRDEAASTTAFKRFAGGFCQIVTASSSKGLQAIPIRYLALDEVSEFPHDVDGRGDPVDLARARQLAQGDLAKELATSTPGLVGSCRITAMYEAGDQRRYYVPCPHCGTFQVLRFENLAFDEGTGRAVFLCQGAGCGTLLDNIDKEDMLAAGRWIPTFVEEVEGEDPERVPLAIPADEIADWTCAPCQGRCRDRQPSYHIWAAYSPFLSWSEIWRRWLEAQGKPLKLKAFWQQLLGIAYDPQGDAPDWEKLVAARENFEPGVVPDRAYLLTGAADVQGNRIEWEVWAWGPNAEGWQIDRGVIEGDPTTRAPWLELVNIVGRSYRATTGVDRPIDLFGVDSGYLSPHVYQFTRGRPTVFALDGRPGPNVPPLGAAKEVRTKSPDGRTAYKVIIYPVGTFGLKTLVHAGLRALLDGPNESGRWPAGTLHLSRALSDEEVIKQLTAESLVERERRDGHVFRSWEKAPGRRNEALDLAVYNRALAWRLGLDRLSVEQWKKLARERGLAEPAQSDLFEPSLDAGLSEDRLAEIRRRGAEAGKKFRQGV